MSLCPRIEISATVDDFATQFIKGRAFHLVTPLRQLGAITDDVELEIAQDVVTIIFE